MKNLTLLRRISQVSVVGLTVYLGIRHQIVGGGPQGAGPIDSYCPFGGIETLFSWGWTGQFLDKTNTSNLVLLGAVLVLAVLAGAAFCGWLCPFGAVQEWLGKLGKKLFGRNFNLPARIHRPLRHLRYVNLAVIVFFTVRTSSLVFQDYDPFKVLFHFNFETTTAWIILALTIILSMAVESFWCKYLCPLGALFSLFGRFSLVNIRRDQGRCLECGLCSKICPAQIQVAAADKVPTTDCTKCFQCLDVCPQADALTINLGGDK